MGMKICYYLLSFLWTVLAIWDQLSQLLPENLVISISIHWVGLLFDILLDYHVDSQLKGIIQHSRDQLSQKGARAFNTGVLVDFNKPHFQLSIYKKVKSKDLKAMLPIIGINFFLNRTKYHVRYFLDLIPYLLYLFLGNVVFEIPKRQLVCTLELPIVFRLFLNGIISEMDEVVFDIVS